MSATKAVKQGAAVSADGSHKNVPMRESGLASVIIPCYNQAHFLHEAIESASAQTYSHREILVVDDGSTDNTAKVTAGYPGVRYVRQENLGVASARNTGFKQSRGEYLVFLDADDRLLPEALRVGVDCLVQEICLVIARYDHGDQTELRHNFIFQQSVGGRRRIMLCRTHCDDSRK